MLTSKHLLNKWTHTLSIAGKIIPFTRQYTYTVDAQDRPAKLAYTGNPTTFFSYTSANCQ